MPTIGYDGHTIWSPRLFENTGFPEEWYKPLIKTFKSDGTPNGTLYTVVDGEVEKLQGIFGLDALKQIADDVGIDTSKIDNIIGNGFKAKELTLSIMSRIENVASGI